jgi:hypothetical protein
LSRATKGKKVIYRKDFYCQHADIANIRKQTRVKQQNENNSRNRNTECLATLLIKIQTKDLASSHPCTVWLNFILITIIQSIHFILYPFDQFQIQQNSSYNKLFEKGYNAATEHHYYEFLTTNEDDLQLILANRAINPDRCAA